MSCGLKWFLRFYSLSSLSNNLHSINYSTLALQSEGTCCTFRHVAPRCIVISAGNLRYRGKSKLEMSKKIELWSTDGGELEAHKLFSDRLRSQESRSARDFKNTSQSVEKLLRIKRRFAPMFASIRQSSCLLFLFFIPVSLCYLEEVPGNSNVSAFPRWDARISSDPQLIPDARERHHRHKNMDFQGEHQWNLKKKKDSLRHKKKNRRFVDPKDFQFLDPKPGKMERR